MLEGLLKQTPYLQHQDRILYLYILSSWKKTAHALVIWMSLLCFSTKKESRVAPDTKCIKCWISLQITDFFLSVDNHRLHGGGGSWSYIQTAEILCELLSYKEVESTNLFHRMVGREAEQEGIITKLHCQKNSPCVANTGLK